jgi:hypothetical protein
LRNQPQEVHLKLQKDEILMRKILHFALDKPRHFRFRVAMVGAVLSAFVLPVLHIGFVQASVFSLSLFFYAGVLSALPYKFSPWLFWFSNCFTQILILLCFAGFIFSHKLTVFVLALPLLVLLYIHMSRESLNDSRLSFFELSGVYSSYFVSRFSIDLFRMYAQSFFVVAALEGLKAFQGGVNFSDFFGFLNTSLAVFPGVAFVINAFSQVEKEKTWEPLKKN